MLKTATYKISKAVVNFFGLKRYLLSFRFVVKTVQYLDPKKSDSATSFEYVFSKADKPLYQRISLSESCSDTNEKFISVIIPIYKPELLHLLQMLDSVRSQDCNHFDIILAFDGPLEDDVIRSYLERIVKIDNKIKILESMVHSGISSTTNFAIKESLGDWLIFVDQDDLLTENVIPHLHNLLSQNSEPRYIYTDHDKIRGNLYGDLDLKPSFSPTLLMSYMYIGHLKVVHKDIFERVGYFLSEFDGLQDYEFSLRCLAHQVKFEHVPIVGYSWRISSNSLTNNENSRSKFALSQKYEKALENFSSSMNFELDCFLPDWALERSLGILKYSHAKKEHLNRITIVIPTIKLELIQASIESLVRADLLQINLLIVDNTENGILQEPVKEILKRSKFQHFEVLHIKNIAGSFSYARIMNLAALKVTTDEILFLNDDVRMFSDNWLSEMQFHLNSFNCGVVGAKLLFLDNSVQHNGVLSRGYDDLPMPLFRGVNVNDGNYSNLNLLCREVDAVTAACMLLRRDTFRDLGGFDERDFAVAFNDIDFCNRASNFGFQSVVCVDAIGYHQEGSSRSNHDNPKEQYNYRTKYANQNSAFYPDKCIRDHVNNYTINLKQNVTRALELKRMKHVLIASHNLNLEGAPKYLIPIVRNFLKKNINVTITSPVDGPMRHQFENLGARVLLSPSNPGYDQAKHNSYISTISSLIKNFSVDLVIANTSHTSEWILSSREVAKPSIWINHEGASFEDQFPIAPEWYFDRLNQALNAAEQNIFVSISSANLFKHKLLSNNYTIINGAINSKVFYPIVMEKTDKVKFLSVGTFCERKNQLLLLKSFEEAFSNNLGVAKLTMIGNVNDDYSLKIIKEVKRLQNNGFDIVVHEKISDENKLAEKYRESHVFVSSSVNESYPLTILEAIACGLPVVGFAVNGVVNQIHDGFNGILMNKIDSHTLANALQELASDEALLALLISNTLSLSKYSQYEDTLVRRFEEEISKII